MGTATKKKMNSLQGMVGDFLLEKKSIFFSRRIYLYIHILNKKSGHIIKIDGAVWTPWLFLQFCPFQLFSICFYHTVRKACQVTWDTIFLSHHTPSQCWCVPVCAEGCYFHQNGINLTPKTLAFSWALEELDDLSFCVVYFSYPNTYIVSTHSFPGLDSDVLKTILGFLTWLRLEKRPRY